MAWIVYGFITHSKIHGPLPRKRWVKQAGEKKYKLAYRGGRAGPRSRRDTDTLRRVAIEYTRWLAQRDGIAIDAETTACALFAGRKVWAVQFGETRIEIPNWDFEHPEVVEEIIEEPERLAA